MACDLGVSAIVPPCRTSRPASPSLQWVPTGSVPHLPDRSSHDESHRYYAPLRLSLSISSGSLIAPSRIPSWATVICVLFSRSLLRRSQRKTPGLLVSQYPSSSGSCTMETGDPPEFPDYPSDHMLRPKTPVVTVSPCLKRRRPVAFQQMQNCRLWLAMTHQLIQMDHHYTFFGVQLRGL